MQDFTSDDTVIAADDLIEKNEQMEILKNNIDKLVKRIGNREVKFDYIKDLVMSGSIFADKIKDIMENAVSLEVPNKVDYESGPNWGTIK